MGTLVHKYSNRSNLAKEIQSLGFIMRKAALTLRPCSYQNSSSLWTIVAGTQRDAQMIELSGAYILLGKPMVI